MFCPSTERGTMYAYDALYGKTVLVQKELFLKLGRQTDERGRIHVPAVLAPGK